MEDDPRTPDSTGHDTPGADPATEGGDAEPHRSLEALFQELIRRGASLGFSSFFLTDEAVRRAFSERVPSQWTAFLGRQGEDLRAELVDRLAKEFGQWLRGLDLAQLVDEFLRDHRVTARIELEATRKSPAEDGSSPSNPLQIVTRRK